MKHILATIAPQAVVVALLAICGLPTGCTNRSAPLGAAEKQNAKAAEEPADAKAAQPENTKSLAPRDDWEVFLLQNNRVGYGHTTVRYETDAGQTLVHTENKNHLAVQRGGQTSEYDVLQLKRRNARRKTLAVRERVADGAKPDARRRPSPRQSARLGNAGAGRQNAPANLDRLAGRLRRTVRRRTKLASQAHAARRTPRPESLDDGLQPSGRRGTHGPRRSNPSGCSTARATCCASRVSRCWLWIGRKSE